MTATPRRTIAFLLLVAGTNIAAQSPPADRAATIKFFEDRVARDPDDIVAENNLATLCLGKLRETGDFGWLKRARRAATQSLASVAAARNVGGLEMLTQVEYESHHFLEARDLALQLTKLDPNRSYPFAFLGDAWLEFGEIGPAAAAYAEMNQRRSPPIESESRLARLALARGQLDEAAVHHRAAVQAARNLFPPRPEAVVWALVQLGQLAFSRGDFATAETQYKAALREQTDDPHAIEHLGELRAAQGQWPEAISLYQRAIALTPRPEFIQALGDVYAASGDSSEAEQWHYRARDSYLKNVKDGNDHYFHHLAGYYADVEENAAEAVKWARRDMELRHTGAAHDALAWALYRSGELSAAANEAQAALKTGTRDAHILFHAAMILLAAGDAAKGRDLLANAAKVNPRYTAFHVHR
ncbi:MAG: tetratricopeptide repeat protein [Chthoniobacterales bacterium]